MGKFDSKASELGSRISAPDLREIVGATYSVVERFGAKAGEIRADRRFSKEGADGEIVKALANNLKAIGETRAAIVKRQANIAAERVSLLPRPPDRADLVGAIERQEIRTILRGLPEAERLRVALETTDPQIRDAIAFSSTLASGISPDLRAQILESMVEEKAGSRLAEIKAGADALDATIMTIFEAENDLRRESGLIESEFEQAKRGAA